MTHQDRLELLRSLLRSEKLSNQQETLKRLEQMGIHITQSTLSRDFRLLGVRKLATEQGERPHYVCSQDIESIDERQRSYADIARGFINVVLSGSMAVIKTYPGQASSVAAAIDYLDLDLVHGTIAGDDTIFAVLLEGTSTEEFRQALGLE